MVVLGVRAHLPLVDTPAPPLGLDAVLRRQMLREEKMILRASPEERQSSPVAGRGKKPRRHEGLPEVGVVDDMPYRPLAAHIRHAPVETNTVADHALVLAHRLGGCAHELTVRRREDGSELRLPAELVHGVRRLSPVGVHKALLDPHRRSVVAEILATEDFFREVFESLVEASLETASRKLLLERDVRVVQREEPSLLVRPLAVVYDAPREIVVPRDGAVEEHRLLDIDERREVRRRDGNAKTGVSFHTR